MVKKLKAVLELTLSRLAVCEVLVRQFFMGGEVYVCFFRVWKSKELFLILI